MSLRIDNSLLITGGLASQMRNRVLPGGAQWQRERAQTHPQLPEPQKTIVTRENDAYRASTETPGNFKIKTVEPIQPTSLSKPVKIDIRA